MKPSTRERKERFIQSFDRFPGSTIDDGIGDCLSRHGWSWLTDAQIAEITSITVGNARFSQRLRVRNRNALKRAS